MLALGQQGDRVEHVRERREINVRVGPAEINVRGRLPTSPRLAPARWKTSPSATRPTTLRWVAPTAESSGTVGERSTFRLLDAQLRQISRRATSPRSTRRHPRRSASRRTIRPCQRKMRAGRYSRERDEGPERDRGHEITTSSRQRSCQRNGKKRAGHVAGGERAVPVALVTHYERRSK